MEFIPHLLIEGMITSSCPKPIYIVKKEMPLAVSVVFSTIQET
jgi:hypothetical protein